MAEPRDPQPEEPSAGPDEHGSDSADDASVNEALQGAADQGDVRLRRSAVALLATGAIAGIDVGMGVLAKLSVLEATGSELLGGAAFSIGFIALVLGRSELFTENFLLPVTAALRRDRTLWSLLRLWSLTALGNLVGGWVMMAIIVLGVPRIRESDVLVETAAHFLDLGLIELLASGMLGGAAITLMTWMRQGTDSVLAQLVAVSAIAFVFAGTPLLHAVVSSLEFFGALQVSAPFGYLAWLESFGIAVVGNIVGGVGLVTVLRVVQARGEESSPPTTPPLSPPSRR